MTQSNATLVVCIVEDDSAVRDSLSAVVETLGCRVKSFASAEEFLAGETVAGLKFLIVDVRLPGMSGVELLEQIAFHKSLPPTIVMTGHADAKEMKLDFWPNKMWFLVKPCDPGKLLAIISNSLSE